nr:MAG TPA: hypothetical protein [Caudoviricetes sp.]
MTIAPSWLRRAFNLIFCEVSVVAKQISFEDFCEKFKPKKTTDDCYTPPTIYEVIKKLGLQGIRHRPGQNCAAVLPWRRL